MRSHNEGTRGKERQSPCPASDTEPREAMSAPDRDSLRMADDTAGDYGFIALSTRQNFRLPTRGSASYDKLADSVSILGVKVNRQ